MAHGNKGPDLEVLVALADTSVSRKDKILGIAGPLAEELKETN